MGEKNGGTNMLTEKDYCDYDTCVALKELGFNQYTTLRTYAGKGGVWLGELPNPEPDYKEGDLIALHHTYGIPSDGIEIAAPSLYEAQKWLREEKKIEVNATSDLISNYQWFWEHKSLTNMNSDVSYPYYKTYEEALLEGIKEAVKILKEGKE